MSNIGDRDNQTNLNELASVRRVNGKIEMLKENKNAQPEKVK
jgi:hypothetical protein